MKLKSGWNRTKVWMGALVACVMGGPLQAADLLVPGQYPDISSAHAAAAQFGDRIVLATGVYSGAANSLGQVTKSIDLVGQGASTIIDLQGMGNFADFDFWTVFKIENLTFVWGDSRSTTITVTRGNLALNQVDFIANSSELISAQLTSQINLNGCSFIGNVAQTLVTSGFKITVKECVFSGNAADCIDANGMTARVEKTLFDHNARCLILQNSFSSSVVDCWFDSNARAIDSLSDNRLSIHASTFKGNDSVVLARMCESLNISDCLIHDNGLNGGPPVVDARMNDLRIPPLLWITQCTIVDNLGTSVVDVGQESIALFAYVASVKNNILWNPAANGEISILGTSASYFDRNLVRGGGFGQNMISGTPQFRDSNNLDFSLAPTSPGHDAGADLGPGSDLNGTPRTSTPDIGSFEATVSVQLIQDGFNARYVFTGNPGDTVGVFFGFRDYIGTPTPAGLLQLDPQSVHFVGVVGTIGQDGRLVVASPASFNPSAEYSIDMQALVGSTLTTNVTKVYLD